MASGNCAYRAPNHPKRSDHRDVPDHRRGVGKKKFAVAVQDPQAPRGQHEQSRAGKQDAHDANGQLAFFAGKSGSDRVNQIRGRQHAKQDEYGGAEGQQRRHGSRGAACFLLLSARQQRSIHGDEGCGEHALAKQILQRVGNAECRFESVRGVGISEVMGKYAVANQARNTAEKNSGGDQKRRALRGEPAGNGCTGFAHARVRSGKFICTRYPLQELPGWKSTTSVKGCAVPVQPTGDIEIGREGERLNRVP